MTDMERIKSLIHRYDDTIRYRHKLFDYNFTVEMHSVLKTLVTNQETLKAQLDEKTKECEYLRECMNIAHDKVAKLYTQIEDRTNLYQGLLKNSYAKEFLDDNIENEFEALKLLLECKTGECDQLKIRSNEANEHIPMLNSDLTATHESFRAAKLRLSQVGSKSHEINNSRIDIDCGSLISPPSNFRNDDESTKNMKPDESFTKNREHHPEILNTPLAEICNSSVSGKFREHVPEQSSNNFIKEKTSSLTTSKDKSPIRSSVSDSPEKSQTEISSLCCEICGLKYSTERNLKAHLRHAHPKEKRYECAECAKRFALKHHLQRHTLIHGLHKPFKCSVCNVGFNQWSARRRHERNIHEGGDRFQCAHCDKPFGRKDQLIFHIHTVHDNFFEMSKSGISSLCCDICGKQFLRKYRLEKHMLLEHKREKSYKCTICGKRFAQIYSLEKHRAIHGSRPFKCSFCNKCFKYPDSKLRHEKVVHRGKAHLQCAHCSEQFGRKKWLISHLHTEHYNFLENSQRGGIPSLRCDICGRQYSHKYNLGNHIRQVHQGEKPYECAECGKWFTQKTNWKRHTLIHGSKKPFECSFCDAGFKDPSSKRKHERSLHKTGAHLQCKHCDKRFSVKTNLISHVHTEHFTGFEDKFKCIKCNKSFALKRQLQEHKLSHVSLKVFKCSVCNCYFKYRRDRTRHQNTAHKQGFCVSCKDCDIEVPVSPPPDFRGDDKSVEVDSHEFFLKKEEHDMETNSLDQISNLLDWRELPESGPKHSSNYFSYESKSPLKTEVNAPPLQCDVYGAERNALDEISNSSDWRQRSDNFSKSLRQSNAYCVNIENCFQPVQEFYGFTSRIDDFKTIAMKRSIGVDVHENSVIDTASHKSPEPLKVNENLTSSDSFDNHGQKSMSEIAKLPNSIAPAIQPHLSSNNNGKSCRDSLKTKKNGESVAVDNVHIECENGNSKVRCDICGKSYMNKYRLNRHIRQVHVKEKPYECITCGKRFTQKYNLKKHTAAHSSDRPFKCSVCNECFKSSSNKKYHERVVHKGYDSFQCAHCDKACTQKHHLIPHIFSQHFTQTEKQFKCDICEKSFVLRYLLKSHKVMHASERPFKCSICDQRFKHRHNKLQHEKKFHR